MNGQAANCAPARHGRVLLVHNPAAGARRRRFLARVLRELDSLGVAIERRETGRRGDAEAIAAEATRDRYDSLVVAGGDGTINEVVNGMRANSPPLAIVPMGTANVAAAEIGLESSPASVARTIAAGRPSRVNLGRANGRRFVMMAGAGFDARVVAHVDARLKRRIGKGAYLWQCLAELIAKSSPKLRVRIGDYEREAGSVVAANGHYYAGRFVLAEQADLAAARLDVCLFKGSRRLDVVRYALALGARRVGRLADVERFATERVEIVGPEGAPVQGDGDIVATLPATITLERNAIEILRPEPGPVGR